MIAWLWELIVGNFCRHKWEKINEHYERYSDAPDRHTYHLQCKKCGDVKFKSCGGTFL